MEAGMLDLRWHLGGWVAVLDEYAIMDIKYCYSWIICGCQSEMGLEVATTRTMHGAHGPLPKRSILEHHFGLRSKVSCSVPW